MAVQRRIPALSRVLSSDVSVKRKTMCIGVRHNGRCCNGTHAQEAQKRDWPHGTSATSTRGISRYAFHVHYVIMSTTWKQCPQVLLILNHCHHLEIHWIMLICLCIRRSLLNAFIVLLCILFYLVGLAIFMSHFLAFVFILLLSDFNMFDVLYDMLVALVALCHLQIKNEAGTRHHPASLTLSVPHLSDCSKMSLPNRPGPYWSNPPFFNFWHSGSLALSLERQRARVSKIKKWWVRPVWPWTLLRCNHLAPLGFKGLRDKILPCETSFEPYCMKIDHKPAIPICCEHSRYCSCVNWHCSHSFRKRLCRQSLPVYNVESLLKLKPHLFDLLYIVVEQV